MRTYRGIPVQGQFLASDSEGEDMTFTLVEEPRKGTVTIQGADFTYTPDEGVTGGDSFTYAATDSAGHVSQPATVTVTIEKTKSGVTYADTEGSSAAAAAQHLAEAGIFTGTKIGDQYYFQPDAEVSRIVTESGHGHRRDLPARRLHHHRQKLAAGDLRVGLEIILVPDFGDRKSTRLNSSHRL